MTFFRLIIYYDVLPPLHANYHHEIMYAKFNLTILYPPSYKQPVWHYQLVNTDPITQAIKLFDWEKIFLLFIY